MLNLSYFFNIFKLKFPVLFWQMFSDFCLPYRDPEGSVVYPKWFIPDPDPAFNFPSSGSGSKPYYLSTGTGTLYLEIK